MKSCVFDLWFNYLNIVSEIISINTNKFINKIVQLNYFIISNIFLFYNLLEKNII